MIEAYRKRVYAAFAKLEEMYPDRDYQGLQEVFLKYEEGMQAFDEFEELVVRNSAVMEEAKKNWFSRLLGW